MRCFLNCHCKNNGWQTIQFVKDTSFERDNQNICKHGSGSYSAVESASVVSLRPQKKIMLMKFFQRILSSHWNCSRGGRQGRTFIAGENFHRMGRTSMVIFWGKLQIFNFFHFFYIQRKNCFQWDLSQSLAYIQGFLEILWFCLKLHHGLGKFMSTKFLSFKQLFQKSFSSHRGHMYT
jgi:hypothetical protein